jgi:citrate lyase subunit beta/citryl-CoA lyase
MTGLLRRSELALPASNDHMFAKALACGADLVFIDLEDAVPPAFKEESREKAITALTELDWGSTARAVRINGLDTGWCHDDIIEVVTRAGAHLDTSPSSHPLEQSEGNFRRFAPAIHQVVYDV